MNTSVQWVALVSAILAGAASAAFVARRAGHRGAPVRIGSGDVVRAGLLVVGIVVCCATVGASAGSVDMFGLVSFFYFGGVVAVPVAAVGLVAWVRGKRTERRITRPARVLLVPALLAGALGIWGSRVEPYRLELDLPPAMQLASTRSGAEAIRVGVLTDIQTVSVGDHEHRAVDWLMAEHPDLILLPGDIFQGSPEALDEELPALRELFGKLDAPGGVFAVAGDADTDWQSTGSSSRLDRIFEGTRVRMLRNDVITTRVRDRDVRIAGLELDYRSARARGAVASLEAAEGEGDVRILLSHRPDSVYQLASNPRTDLVVAGHTHGGQIALPGIGPLITLSEVPRNVGAGGLHDLDGRRIYVGRGVGMERYQAPPVRIGVPPNISVLTLTS